MLDRCCVVWTAAAAILITVTLGIRLGQCYGTHVFLPALAEQVKYSEKILIGNIVNVEKSIWGYVYVKVEPKLFIKGEREPWPTVRFGTLFFKGRTNANRFAKHENYLLFLRKDGEFYSLVGTEYLINGNNEVELQSEMRPVDDVVKQIEDIESRVDASDSKE